MKGVARHAMRSRRRFGGALEPMTHVRATSRRSRSRSWCGWMPSRFVVAAEGSIDYERTAALEFVAEVLEEALPERAPEDAVFRLSLAAMEQMQVGGCGCR